MLCKCDTGMMVLVWHRGQWFQVSSTQGLNYRLMWYVCERTALCNLHDAATTSAQSFSDANRYYKHTRTTADSPQNFCGKQGSAHTKAAGTTGVAILVPQLLAQSTCLCVTASSTRVTCYSGHCQRVLGRQHTTARAHEHKRWNFRHNRFV